MIGEREKYRQVVQEALQNLISRLGRENSYHAAIPYARKLIELDPFNEVANIELMHFLAKVGQRGAALYHYDTYCGLLKEELAIEPSDEMKNLYRQIQSGEFKASALINHPEHDAQEIVTLPIKNKKLTFQDSETPFVDRKRELTWLNKHFQQVLQGQGKMAFIKGEAGSGKSFLIKEFARNAQCSYPNLIVATGICSVFIGEGDIFQPFRDVLEALLGGTGCEIEDKATRSEMEEFCKSVARLLLEFGPDLVINLIPASILDKIIPKDGSECRDNLEKLLENFLMTK